MQLKMSTHQEYISQLYTQGQFKQMLQYGKQALSLALKISATLKRWHSIRTS